MLIGRTSDTCESCTSIEVIQEKLVNEMGRITWSLQMSLKRSSDSKPSKDSAAKTRPIKSCRRIHTSMGCQIQGTHGQAMNYDWPFNINSTLRICVSPTNTQLSEDKSCFRERFFFGFLSLRAQVIFVLFIPAYFKFFILSGLL